MNSFETKHLEKYLPSDISNYDVLLRKHHNNHVEIISFHNHIGNRRFQIMLENHKKAYNTALQQQNRDRCEIIIKTIAHTICQTCIPRGRFLEFTKIDSEAHWDDLGQGHLVWDRIYRGLAGLLYLPPTDMNESLPLPNRSRNKRKRIHVNLADERFKMKEQKLSNQEEGSPFNEIPYQTTDIRPDDVLFYGNEKNSIIIFSNHTGNNRLKHLIGLKIKKHNINSKEDIYKFSREIARDLVTTFPKTRYLRQQGDAWIVVDIETATTILRSAMSLAWNFYSKDEKLNHESTNETKTSWDVSMKNPKISVYNSSRQDSRNSSPVGNRAA